MKIEGYNRHTASANFSCDYLYLLQNLTPNASNITLLTQSQRKMTYLTGTSITLVDLANVTGSGYLIGMRIMGYYASAIGEIYGDITIDGINKMSDRLLIQTGTVNYKVSEFVGPIRFASSLRIRTRTSAAGSPYVCEAWYSLDA